MVDKSAPLIAHSLSPAANAAGWNRTRVTVTFACADSVSEVASCTPSQDVTTEGSGQLVPGTATDLAGNSANDTATVNLDQTDPTISAAADRSPNANGWYRDAVTVSFA